MRNLANFVLFQAGWFACVLPAAEGRVWWGALAASAILVVHFAFVVSRGERSRQGVFVAAVGLAGAAVDSGLSALGLIVYPTSTAAWPFPFVPPWIAALWVLFATLPHHSLGWLRGRTGLAVVLGAVGGPLSFLAGTRTGAVAAGEEPLWTWIALPLEYAVATPVLLRLSRRR